MGAPYSPSTTIRWLPVHCLRSHIYLLPQQHGNPAAQAGIDQTTGRMSYGVTGNTRVGSLTCARGLRTLSWGPAGTFMHTAWLETGSIE